MEATNDKMDFDSKDDDVKIIENEIINPKGSGTSLKRTRETRSDHPFEAKKGSPLDSKIPDLRRKLAERKKNEGNELYKKQEYRDALKLYSKAIEICPDCAAYYSNRSACYIMLGKYSDALADAQQAIRLDTTLTKGYIRVAKCIIALGDANAAMTVLKQAHEIDPNTPGLQTEMKNAEALLRHQAAIAKAVSNNDYRTAIFYLDRALEVAVGCLSMKNTKAEYLVFLGKHQDASDIVNDILQLNRDNVDAMYVKGMILYYLDNPDAAFAYFQQTLVRSPDHQKAKDIYKKAKHLKAKKEEGNKAFNAGQLPEALKIYTEALSIDPVNKYTNAKLRFNRAIVYFKQNKHEEAIDDCTEAINLDEKYIKAYLRRAKSYQLTNKHEEAVRDYQFVFKLEHTEEHRRLLEEAEMQLKISKRKDYYKILGVPNTASVDDIKKSYKKKALLHHPDRHANADDKEKREHEIKFKEIGEAYAILTDPQKRHMYDNKGFNFSEGNMDGFDDMNVSEAYFSKFFKDFQNINRNARPQAYYHQQPPFHPYAGESFRSFYRDDDEN